MSTEMVVPGTSEKSRQARTFVRAPVTRSARAVGPVTIDIRPFGSSGRVYQAAGTVLTQTGTLNPTSTFTNTGTADIRAGTILQSTSTFTNFASQTLTGGTYHYNWVPKAAWVGTCRQLVVKLRDGSFNRANFRFVSG